MAKIDNVTGQRKGERFTSKGFLPPDHLKRHNLVGNMPNEDVNTHRRAGKTFKRMVELVKFYRLQSHGVLEPKLAKPLVRGIHYMLTPMGKSSYDEKTVAASATDVN